MRTLPLSSLTECACCDPIAAINVGGTNNGADNPDANYNGGDGDGNGNGNSDGYVDDGVMLANELVCILLTQEFWDAVGKLHKVGYTADSAIVRVCVCVDLVSGGKGSFVKHLDYQVPRLVPPPPRHLITKLKGSTESHVCTPRFPPSRCVPLAEKINKCFNAVATRGRQSRPL